MSQPLIANRYEIVRKLGSGGMGSVFLVEDRLTNTTVALKQVLIPTEQLQFSPGDSGHDPSTAIAVEFRTLASLRHPHVIRVLDYGFDEHGNPFFTMEYLPESDEFTSATRQVSFENKVNYLVQMLQALAYLHRRGIIHRDLKPANVLVNPTKTVKVLDFGLAIDVAVTANEDDQDDFAGTIAYVAPEILQGQSASVASDLYAVGVIGYEVFAGKHPFNLESITTLLMNILQSIPEKIDIDNLDVVELIATLLEKEPERRPDTANAVIEKLYAALELDMPEESSQIRDSFLKASRFVGRKVELECLSSELQRLKHDNAGKSFWLVGGESGVGKSRLLEEVRVHALVQGVRVLRGQAVESGGVPYQMWRDVLRPLLLSVSISDLEAGILKEIVPDMSEFLQRDIPDVAALPGKANLDRLALTITDVFKRQQQPALLLLEDLQWAGESLDILKTLLNLSEQIAGALMIVATYRTDDAPQLPDQLSLMQTMTLERFSRETITSLSKSMLGESGEATEIIDLLEKETEGNVYFIVEVVRALAETAGRLDSISESNLPRQVVAGGVQAVLRRRLARIPAEFQQLLQHAAIAGRELDQVLLAQLSSITMTDDFITVGANTAVLDVVDGVWRFAHDKLRQAVLSEIAEDQLPQLHRDVAEAIEQTYPDDENYAEALAQLWDTAGDAEKAIHNIIIASERITNFVADYDRAEALLHRGLELVKPLASPDRYLSQLYRLLGNVAKRRADYEQAEQQFQKGLTYAGDDLSLQIPNLWNLSEVAYFMGRPDAVEEYANRVVEIANEVGDIYGKAVAIRNLGKVAVDQGKLDQGFTLLNQSIELTRQSENDHATAVIFNDMGIICAKRGDFKEAETYFTRSLEVHRKNGSRANISNILTNLGMLANLNGNYEIAQQHFSESSAISEQIGYQMGVAVTQGHLGMIANAQETFDEAITYFDRALTIFREHKLKPSIATELTNQAFAYIATGNLSAARKNIKESLSISQEIGSEPRIMNNLMMVAEIRLRSDDITSAVELLGFIEAQTTVSAEYRGLYLQPVRDRALQKFTSTTEFEQAIARGQVLKLEAILLALQTELDTST